MYWDLIHKRLLLRRLSDRSGFFPNQALDAFTAEKAPEILVKAPFRNLIGFLALF